MPYTHGYNITIVLTNGAQHTLKELNPVERDKIVDNIYRRGFVVKINDNKKELVSPFLIQRVFIESYETGVKI